MFTLANNTNARIVQAFAGHRPTSSGRRRILVSAYTLSPTRGSEPAGAWNVVTRLAAFHDVTVLTSSNVEGEDYRKETAAYLNAHPVPGLTLVYIEPPLLARTLIKPTGTLARLLYYVGYASWQREAMRRAQRLHSERRFDLIHQLNMTGYREPGYLWKLNAPFVWGPIGGASNVPWSFLPTMSGKERLLYGIRNIANYIQRYTHRRCNQAANAARKIWYIGSDERAMIEEVWSSTAGEPMLDSGTLPAPREPVPYDGKRPLRIVWSGVHIGRKGFPILARAMAQIPSTPLEVHVLGSGPQTEFWDTVAARYGVVGHIKWLGRLPRDKAVAEMANADVLVFTSLSEGAPYVVLEALSMGLPVICHDACGMGVAVDSTSGIKVPLRNLKTSVHGFATAIRRLAEDPSELRRLAEGANRRATELTWDAKVEQLCRAYGRILGDGPAQEPVRVTAVRAVATRG